MRLEIRASWLGTDNCNNLIQVKEQKRGREKNREEARKKKRIKELGLRRNWDMERMYAGEEQRKKREKKEGERRDKTKKWEKNRKSTEGREQKKIRT